MWMVLAAAGIVMLDWMQHGVEGGERVLYKKAFDVEIFPILWYIDKNIIWLSL